MPDSPSAESVDWFHHDDFTVDEVRHLPLDMILRLPFRLEEQYYEQFNEYLADAPRGLREQREIRSNPAVKDWSRTLIGALIMQHPQTIVLRDAYFYNKGEEPEPGIDEAFSAATQLVDAVAATSMAGSLRPLAEYKAAAHELGIVPVQAEALLGTMIKFHTDVVAIYEGRPKESFAKLAVIPLAERKPQPSLPATLEEAFRKITRLCNQAGRPTVSGVKECIDAITHKAVLSGVTKSGLVRLLRQDSRTAPLRLQWHEIIR